MSLNDRILYFEGRSPLIFKNIKIPPKNSKNQIKHVLIFDFFFFWFSMKVSEQSDQVAQKPDFRLGKVNNNLKQEDDS